MDNIVLKTTKDYSKFKMHDQNRLLMNGEGYKPRPDLLASMKVHGFRKAQPIRVTKGPDGELRIFDGHNRYVTAKYLGIPLWYMEFAPEDAITPVEDNQQNRPWGIKDRAKAYAHDVPDYAEVIAFHEATGISVRGAFSLFGGQTATSNNFGKEINEGRFRIRNRDYPWKVAEIVFAFGKHVPYAATDRLVSAISKVLFVEEFRSDRMIERINRRPELIHPCRSWSEYIQMLEQIYNHGVKGERLYLVTETEKAMRSRNIAFRKR